MTPAEQRKQDRRTADLARKEAHRKQREGKTMSEHCGSSKGYRRHSALKEPICETCSTWRREYRAANKLDRPEPKMTAEELIHEIERLLSYGEGEHAIVTGVGYRGKEKSLRKRLYVHGRADLNERIFYTAEVAA